MNDGFDHHIRLLTGYASWKNIFRQYSATKIVHRKHGSNVAAGHRYIGQDVFL
jgi:hypothetical protein